MSFSPKAGLRSTPTIRVSYSASGAERVPGIALWPPVPATDVQFWSSVLFASSGELIAWSRILDDEEALCIINGHGSESRGADILVDANLNASAAPGNPWEGSAPFFTVIANSSHCRRTCLLWFAPGWRAGARTGQRGLSLCLDPESDAVGSLGAYQSALRNP